MRIAIAGAGGVLGRELVPLLASKGHEVVALVRSAKIEPMERVRETRVDLMRPNEALAAALEGADVLFSAAGAPVGMGLKGGRTGFDRADVPMHRALVDAAKSARVKKLVYLGVAGHEELAYTTYVRAHEDVLAMMRASGIETGVVRATGFFSALTMFLDFVRLRLVPDLGGGKAKTNPIHEKDLADVCAEVIESRGAQEIEAGGPDVMTRGEILDLAARAANVRAIRVPTPAWMARLGAAILSPFHPRIAQFTEFAAALASHDSLAPRRGTRHLDDYFRAHLAR
jgi:uncharacterized protein YbjT (DUF2867 family)